MTTLNESAGGSAPLSGGGENRHRHRRRRWRHDRHSRRKRIVNLVIKALIYIVGIAAILFAWMQLTKP